MLRAHHFDLLLIFELKLLLLSCRVGHHVIMLAVELDMMLLLLGVDGLRPFDLIVVILRYRIQRRLLIHRGHRGRIRIGGCCSRGRSSTGQPLQQILALDLHEEILQIRLKLRQPRLDEICVRGRLVKVPRMGEGHVVRMALLVRLLQLRVGKAGQEALDEEVVAHGEEVVVVFRALDDLEVVAAREHFLEVVACTAEERSVVSALI